MELPAHLAIGFLDGELSTTLIKVLELDAISLLRTACILVKRLQLALNRSVHVSSFHKILAQHSPLSQNLEGVADSLTYEHLVNTTIIVIVIIPSVVALSIFRSGVNLFGLFKDALSRGSKETSSILADLLRW